MPQETQKSKRGMCKLAKAPAAGGLCLALLASALASGPSSRFGDQSDGTFRNPIMPADYSDIDAIRVGTDYYAISSTFQFSPGMVVLRSRDLVNWRTIGHVVQDVTAISPEMNWNRMNRAGRGIWAGSIRYHEGKFWVYFGTPDEGYFMTTAKAPAGPWEPLTQVMKARGWDDVCPFWDDDGQAYLVGSRFQADPVDGATYKIHLFKLTPDGTGLVRGSDRVIYYAGGTRTNNIDKGSEANKLYKWNGLYYHYFSEVKPEGRVAMMGRARSISGPYEYRQLNHVDPVRDREPNQGGIVQTHNGDWWFVTHQGTGGHWEGRAMCLLPVTWKEGWPLLGTVGPDGIGNMTWQARKPIEGEPPMERRFRDEFENARLRPEWEWNYQPRRDKWSLTERPGWLRLHAFKPLRRGDLLTAADTLTQRSFNSGGSLVVVKLDISRMADGQSAGLCHFSSDYGWLGVTQSHGVRRITYSTNGRKTWGPLAGSREIWLRSRTSTVGAATWSFSLDGKSYTAFGETYQLKWGNYRGDRIGILCYNDEVEAGVVDVDWFDYDFSQSSRQE